MNWLLKISFDLLILPLKIIGLLIPKNKNIWVFGSWRGESFSDNSKALFLYVEKNIKFINPVWLTKNREVLNKLKHDSENVYYFYSFKGFYYSLIAKVAIMSTSWIDLPISTFFFPWRIKLIQLWHGTPLKKIDLKSGTLKERILRWLFISYLGREYDMVTSANQNNIKIYTKIFNLKAEKIKITGQPRNDFIFLNKKFYHDKIDINKKFLYMPTWRNYEFDLFGEDFDVEKINNFLRKNNGLLVIKIHPNEVKKYKSKFNYNNIIFWDNRDIYPFLSNFDALITDYSSIYFDFLILDKPIIFTPFDLNKYLKLNGLYYKYNQITPGLKTKNWDEVMNGMQNVFDEIDSFKEERSLINRDFNRYQDNRSSERVFKEILKII